MLKLFAITLFVAYGWASNVSEEAYVAAIIQDDDNRCAGAIVSDQWILTTGRCAKYLDLAVSTITVGTNDLSKLGQIFSSQEVKEHPNYVDIGSFNYDLALIKLNSTIKLGQDAKIIELTGEDIKDMENLAVAGWKRKRDPSPTTKLQLIDVIGVGDNSKCSKLEGQDAKNVFCLVGDKMSDEEKVASGGYQGGVIMGLNHTLKGIVSGFSRPDDPDSLGLAMRVFPFKKWIMDNIK
ncbi:unnamed protein product [Leptosia nina]|uniref:Peptidase S1 domain-containing protein n=1 Tax=Leptosia nina TaxID=320188 RepID=A0AAV1JKQ5_9NEOP